jgi:hypothetical protein
MGKRYSSVVMSSLKCLDKDENDFGAVQDLKDEDGVRVGIRYIEKVRISS